MKNKDLARAILAQYWDRTLPVDPKAIVEAMGVEVIADPSLGAISGEFRLTTKAPVIRYNSNEPPVRQRFTIAHELGHYALGHIGPDGVFRDPLQNFKASNFDPREVAANRFAADILMPKKAVDQLVEESGHRDLGVLARHFQVSEAAMRYRLKNLGWIS